MSDQGLACDRASRGTRGSGQRALSFDEMSQAFHPGFDLGGRDRGEREAQRVGARAADEKARAGREKDAVLTSCFEQCVGVRFFRKANPDRHPALRLRPVRFGGEMALQGGEHRIAPLRVMFPTALQMALK